MTEHENCFKCRDCRFIYRCPVDPDNSTCDVFTPKREVRLPIEKMLLNKIWAESEEPITLSLKEKVILREVLYEDLSREEWRERNKLDSPKEEEIIGETWKKYMLKGME